MSFEFEDEVTRGWMNEDPPVPVSPRDTPDSMFKRKIYVNLARKPFTEQQLRDYFSQFASVDSVMVSRDGFGNPRGFAFVILTDEHAADMILANKPHLLMGSRLETRRALPKESGSLSNYSRVKIFIGGLPKGNISKCDVEEFFRKRFGSSPLFGISEVCLPVDASNNSKGFSFVTFANEDIVDKILVEIPRVEIFGRICELKRSELREEDLPIPTPHPTVNNTLRLNLTNNVRSSSNQSRDNGGLRLMSLGTEKMRKFDTKSKPLLNLTNVIPSTPSINTTFETNSQQATKRSLNDRETLNCETSTPLSNLDQETLAKVGRLYLEAVSKAIESGSSSDFENSMKSLLISTLHTIASNLKQL